jgi:hypothetical protein
MANITATLLEALNYSATIATATMSTTTTTHIMEWPLDIIANNSHDSDTMSLIITPLALASKNSKHHHTHPETVSPVTLSSEWTRLSRLIFLTILSVVGSVGNIFMISSVMIEDHLKKAGRQHATTIRLDRRTNEFI